MPTPPPFKLATHSGNALRTGASPFRQVCCDADTPHEAEGAAAAARHGRLKLCELDTNFQCSVIGTCMTTAALRKVMSRFIHVDDVGDLDIHHEAVLLASEPGQASRALHKALDRHHDSTLLRFSRVTDASALLALWEESMRGGDIAGAYWAVLTHRHATTAIRGKVFGDVHMLSHLVGAANRADIRRLVALEQANAELREQVEQYQQRHLAREQHIHGMQVELADAQRRLRETRQPPAGEDDRPERRDKARAAAEQVALQTRRREAAEQSAAAAQASAERMAEETAFVRRHAATLAAELAAAEAQLRALAGDASAPDPAADFDQSLAGRRILYVGGRPSSTPSIRALVERHGGDFRHHDGGLEDRKGLLAANVAWAGLVVFPVDCVDHDSVGQLKRLCVRHGIEFLPLRSAGIGSFAAALGRPGRPAEAAAHPPLQPCRKHG